MEVYSTKFKGLKIIKIKKFTDLRGNVIKILNKKNIQILIVLRVMLVFQKKEL